jgi:DNA-binding transcriptional LysR family regulator
MIDRIDLKHMRVFIQLVREKSVSKVAAEAGLTQQAVSGYLKRLRGEFQEELFLRQSNGLQPTHFAFELCAKFGRVLEEVDSIYDDLPFDLASANQTYTIIANEYAQLSYVPLFVRAATALAPNITFNIIDFDHRTHEALLASGEADIVIGFGEFIDQRLTQAPIQQEHYACVVNEHSAIFEQIRHPADLAAFPHVAMGNNGYHFSNTVDAFLKEQGVERRVIAVLPCYTALQSFLSVNDVVAFVPSTMTRLGNFKTIEFAVEPQSFDVVAAWHRRVASNPLHQWVVEQILSLNAP